MSYIHLCLVGFVDARSITDDYVRFGRTSFANVPGNEIGCYLAPLLSRYVAESRVIPPECFLQLAWEGGRLHLSRTPLVKHQGFSPILLVQPVRTWPKPE